MYLMERHFTGSFGGDFICDESLRSWREIKERWGFYPKGAGLKGYYQCPDCGQMVKALIKKPKKR
jgi:hypothetical protein